MLGHAKKGGVPDYLVIIITGFLVLFGLVMLSSASAHLGEEDFGDSYYYLKHQLYSGIFLGLIGYFLTSHIRYTFWKKRWVSISLLVLSILLLLLVFSPIGFTTKGATRWLDIAGMSIQPSEFLKITLIIYLATWLSSKSFRNKSFREGYIPFAIIIGSVCAILIVQRSTSPVLILICASLAMYLMSGARLRYVIGTVILGLLALVLIIRFTPYRAERVLSFRNPEADPRGSGYHIIQAKTAIINGGLTGVGYGQSVTKHRLPEPIGDSIFPIVAEEFGFVGATMLISAFSVLILRIFILAKKTSDMFGRLLLIGFGSVLAIQTFINIGAMTGLLPLTGTPLPFISYGGTMMLTYLTMIGIVANISKYHT